MVVISYTYYFLMIWGFPARHGEPPKHGDGLFHGKIPLSKMDELWVPLFQATPIWLIFGFIARIARVYGSCIYTCYSWMIWGTFHKWKVP